jgi:hypothetical protein
VLLSDITYGINKITPPEMLHTVGVDIVVVIGVIKDSLNDATHTELDYLFIEIYHD